MKWNSHNGIPRVLVVAMRRQVNFPLPRLNFVPIRCGSPKNGP